MEVVDTHLRAPAHAHSQESVSSQIKSLCKIRDK